MPARIHALPILNALIAVSALLPGLAAAQTSPSKFAAVGDIGNTADTAAVAKFLRTQNVGLVLMLGDLCYGSTKLSSQIDANYKLEKAADEIRPALGNHEFDDSCGGGNIASGYRSYFALPGNERYYDFRSGPVHFFVLNSYHDPDGVSATSKQATWLKSRLAASTATWQVVMFHHPPYSSGEHGSSSYMRWPFESWGVDAVLSGHDHDYERVMKDGNGDGDSIPYFVSGLGGKSRRSFGTVISGSAKRYSGAFGALLITATASSLKFEFRNTSGTLIDSFLKKPATALSPTFKIVEPPPQ